MVVGSLGRVEIRRVIKGALGDVRKCYQRQLTKDARLAGRVAAQLVIGSDGKVSVVTVSAGLHPELDRCISSVIGKLRFPKPKGGGIVEVSCPFVFRPRP